MNTSTTAQEALAAKVRLLYRKARRFQGESPNDRFQGWADGNPHASAYAAANAEYHRLYGEYASLRSPAPREHITQQGMTGKELKALRRQQRPRVTQGELAQRMGVTPFTISRWEHQEHIDIVTSTKLRQALGQAICPTCGRAYEAEEA